MLHEGIHVGLPHCTQECDNTHELHIGQKHLYWEVCVCNTYLIMKVHNERDRFQFFCFFCFFAAVQQLILLISDFPCWTVRLGKAAHCCDLHCC